MNNRPEVSVIVICRNEVNYIARCVNAILDQEPGLRTEVIVVDGMSSDGSTELLRSVYGDRIKLLTNTQQYTPHAINMGIREATGDYIAIVGARSILCSTYLSRSVDVLKNDSSTWCTGGRILHKGEDRVSKSIASAMSSVAGVGFFNFRTLTATRKVDTISSPVFGKKITEQIGFFDEACIRNQDDDFSFRIIKAGGTILLNSAISSDYFVRKAYSNLSRQFFQYGFWKIYVNKKHQAITSARQVFPALLIVLLLLCTAISATLGMALLMAYLCVVLASALLTALQHRCAFLPVILSTLIMHFSYGTAYLYGIGMLVILNKPIPETMKALTR